MEGQAKPTLSVSASKIKFIDQEVQQNKPMTTDEKLIDDPVGIALPDQAQTQNVSIPEPFDPATYEAAEAAPKVEQQRLQQDDSSEEAVMEAAQGQISPESLAAAAIEELDPRATTRYQLAELFEGIEEGGPPPAWAAPAVRQVRAVMQQRGLFVINGCCCYHASYDGVGHCGSCSRRQQIRNHPVAKLEQRTSCHVAKRSPLVQMDMATEQSPTGCCQ